MSKTLIWSPQVIKNIFQQDELLKCLKQTQIKDKIINWEIISSTINEKFDKEKTPRQCRVRYINHIKFMGQGEGLNLNWTLEQIQQLIQLIFQHGLEWQIISQKFNNKSQNSVKNKFHNSLKKASYSLHLQDIKYNKAYKPRSITPKLLIPLLALTSKLKQFIKSFTLTINQNCQLFKFHTMLINFCFKSEEFQQQKVNQLLKSLKCISSKLKSFKVFKVKNIKDLKLTSKDLKNICLFLNLVQGKDDDLTWTQIQDNLISLNPANNFNYIEEKQLDFQIFYHQNNRSRLSSNNDLIKQADKILGNTQTQTQNCQYLRLSY